LYVPRRTYVLFFDLFFSFLRQQQVSVIGVDGIDDDGAGGAAVYVH
jgi:hypothetical protein